MLKQEKGAWSILLPPGPGFSTVVLVGVVELLLLHHYRAPVILFSPLDLRPRDDIDLPLLLASENFIILCLFLNLTLTS